MLNLAGAGIVVFVVGFAGLAAFERLTASAEPAFAAALVQPQMDGIYAKVASDAVDQYGIAKRQGDKIQICVHAGLVAAAYLQAKDEAKYGIWKQTERVDCQAAGVPQ